MARGYLRDAIRMSVHAVQPLEVVIRHAAIHICREFRLQAIQEIHIDSTKVLHVHAAAWLSLEKGRNFVQGIRREYQDKVTGRR